MREKIISTGKWIVGYLVLLITGTIALVLVLLTFGRIRNVTNAYIIAPTSIFILFLVGYRIKMPRKKDFPQKQVLYTFNHNSFLDVLMLTALGLPNAFFTLSEKTLWYLPLTISALATGTFYIPLKKSPERRASFFRRTTAWLNKSDKSIIASAEGVHEHFHGIDVFNKGIFRMAMQAKIPVFTLYIHVPEQCNPFSGVLAQGGDLYIELMQEFDTSGWTKENLNLNIEKIRETFVVKFKEAHMKKSETSLKIK
jgi:1-acyl-sn-glycerol-3-phosphate acyltransferase